MDTQILKKILIFLCSIPPDTNLRLMLQLALAADIPEDQQDFIFEQLRSDRSIESLLLERNILKQILDADGELGDAEDNMLFEAMESIGLVVPNDLSGAELLLKELSQNVIAEIQEMDEEEILWED